MTALFVLYSVAETEREEEEVRGWLRLNERTMVLLVLEL